MIDWIKGWWETMMIRFFDPETYAILASKDGFDEDDFVEVERPE